MLNVLTCHFIFELHSLDFELCGLQLVFLEYLDPGEGDLLKTKDGDPFLDAVVDVVPNALLESSLIDFVVKIDEDLRADELRQRLSWVFDTFFNNIFVIRLVLDNSSVDACNRTAATSQRHRQVGVDIVILIVFIGYVFEDLAQEVLVAVDIVVLGFRIVNVPLVDVELPDARVLMSVVLQDVQQDGHLARRLVRVDRARKYGQGMFTPLAGSEVNLVVHGENGLLVFR